MKSAIIYARYSCEKQTEQSIEGQIHECTKFAERNGLVILNTYIDRATTGTNDKREAFQKMLADSDRSQPWEIVLVYALDRFGRNSIEVAINKQRLKKNGKILISATQRTSTNIDGSQNLDGIILENVMIGLSEYYSAELSQKVRRGLAENRRKGLFTGGFLSYGYKVVNKKIEIDEETAEAVRFMYQSYASGNDVPGIIDELTERGIYYRGKPFGRSTVYKILRLSNYIGISQSGGEIVTNKYPPLIPKELFDKVQQLFTIKKGGSNAAIPFLLKNKLYCGLCGHKMDGESGTSQNGTIKYYYKCVHRKRKCTNCSKSAVRKDDIEKLIVDVTHKIMNTPDNISFIADAVDAYHKKKVLDQSIMNLLLSEKAQLDKSIDNIMIAIEQGIITSTTKKRLADLENQRDDLVLKIHAEQCKLNNQINREDVISYLSQVIKHRPQLLIFSFVKKVVLYEDKVEISYNYSEYPPPSDNNPENEQKYFYDFRSNKICPSPPNMGCFPTKTPHILYISQKSQIVPKIVFSLLWFLPYNLYVHLPF